MSYKMNHFLYALLPLAFVAAGFTASFAQSDSAPAAFGGGGAGGGGITLPKNAVASKVMPVTAKFMGSVSIPDLQSKKTQSQAKPKTVEMPKHLLPSGGTTLSKPNLSKLKFPPHGPATKLAPAASSVLNFTGFHGIDSNSNDVANGAFAEFNPPDQGLAVNNNVAAVINNQAVQFFNAANGTPLTTPISAASFFLEDSLFVGGDVQAFFDPAEKVWIFTEIHSDGFFGQGGFNQGFDIAVSKTSNPLGAYNIWHLEAFTSDLPGCAPAADCFPDYPKAGYDKNGLYISVNLFNNTGLQTFLGAATYAIPLSGLKGTKTFTFLRILYPNDFVVQPSVPAPGEPFNTAANGTEFLMEGTDQVGVPNNIRVWAIFNTNTLAGKSPLLGALSVDLPSEPYTATVPAPTPIAPEGSFCTAIGAPSAPPFIDGGFDAFQATIQKANTNKVTAPQGQLYGVLPFADSPTTNSLAWFVVTPQIIQTKTSVTFTAAITNQNYVFGGGTYSFLNPAFGLDKSGKGILGFSVTNPDPTFPGSFPSTAFFQFDGTTPTFGTVTGQGQTADDNFSGCESLLGIDRWGDYGAATVDATTGYYYAANENISGTRGFSTNWGTYITRSNLIPVKAASTK
jgi:hypothetical protein